MTITFEEFTQVDIRSGTIQRAELFERARKPAYKIWVDFGPELGVKQTSAQVTVTYAPETLVGRKIMGAVNLGPRNIAGFESQFLLLGFEDSEGAILLAQADEQVANGQKLH